VFIKNRSVLTRGLAAVPLPAGVPRANIPPRKVDERRSNFRVAHQDRITADLNRRPAQFESGRAQALLMQKIIRGPVDGIVTQRLSAPGEFVHQDNEIAGISRLLVEADPPVRFRNKIHLGDTAPVAIPEPVNVTAKATVVVVDQAFGAASGTFGVRLELPNPDDQLPAGQHGQVTFGFDDEAPSR
jgi:hypothetical protein